MTQAFTVNGQKFFNGEEYKQFIRNRKLTPPQTKNIYKNARFIKRDYDCTNIVACKAYSAPDDNWILVDERELAKLTPLYNAGEVQYYGYL